MNEDPAIRALIIDDSEWDRNNLRRLLKNHGSVMIVGECATGAEAIAAINELVPDLVFLDLEMPDLDGFEVLKQIDKKLHPLVIIVTGHDDLAVKGYEVDPVHFLHKPFDRERIDIALQRVKERTAMRKRGELNQHALALLEVIGPKPIHLDRLLIKTDERAFFLRTAEINWVEAHGKFVCLHTSRESHVFRRSISALLTQLDPTKFLLINRSTIVNVECIRELHLLFHREYDVVLNDGRKLKLTREYREKVAEILGQRL